MKLQNKDKILFQGDSITNAFRKPEEVGSSYRLGSGWVMMVAAQLQAEHPELALEIENRGECGHGVNDLVERWETDCIELKPTVLSLLVGVNDTIRCFRYGDSRPVKHFKENYVKILDRTVEALPGIRIILCEPFLLEAGEVNPAWREDLRGRQEVVRELAKTYGTVFVPLQQRFNEAAAKTGSAYWLFDGIHPHAPGQWLIMQAWLRDVIGPDYSQRGRCS